MCNSNPVATFLKKHVYFLLGVACILIVGAIFVISRGASPQIASRQDAVVFVASEIASPFVEANPLDEIEHIAVEIAEPPAITYIGIHITGAVNSPGFYMIPAGSRVYHAVNIAGGETEYADFNRINLAAFVQDTMKIVVPTQGEEIEFVFMVSTPLQGGGGGGETAPRADGLININTASASELQALSGVGPVLSQNIIDFRNTHGNFANVEELINVPRIGPATLNQIRSQITVGG
ncbi:MAG: helix-hairpin-helix domain-containing protein [Defluviitaleaceae bacterium]|nr:helix-hairpin-helix domain-containing protein [Defluviitaleaceae bacterium]